MDEQLASFISEDAELVACAFRRVPGRRLHGCCLGSARARSSIRRVAPFFWQSPIRSIACLRTPHSLLQANPLLKVNEWGGRQPAYVKGELAGGVNLKLQIT